ncbi:metallophosphoesterase [Lutibacter sp. TH_r2]|uniref:metallophosphoesterase n=1 Tax=Lutibacter sp. TH_r2 TaxID=3082083 RepID=UPI002955ACD1|nr:metallophosphoesterase [Lutibacter sp. TH_r2]MDV7187426.1 metallophosphoesterase [Lutibacter sp. TH_r2]
MNYDIIGDIHGHADELEKLLQKLGYSLNSGVYKHPKGRKVVFLGDYIDRGPKIRETLHIVKNMCDEGSAEAIMGNHEFNAVCFHTPDKENGGFYRKHTFTEINQHFETLKQFKGFDEELELFLNWFKELPLFIEKDNFRGVHACWDDKHISWIKNNYRGKLTIDFLANFIKNDSIENRVIEETLKGKEIILKNGHTFFDKDGVERKECRIKWWQPIENRRNNSDILMMCPVEYGNELIEDDKGFYYTSNKPVFFGHYWLKGNPVIENDKVICLDYSVAKEGQLVAFKSEYLTEEMQAEKGFMF